MYIINIKFLEYSTYNTFKKIYVYINILLMYTGITTRLSKCHRPPFEGAPIKKQQNKFYI